MMRSLTMISLALSFAALGCGETPSSGAPIASATVSAAAKPTATVAAKPAATEAKPAAEPAAAAPAWPATALPNKAFAEFTIGLPPGGKLDKSGDDRAALEMADYKIMLKKADAKDNIAELKPLLQKMPGFKAIVVDQPDGLVIEMEEKGKTEFVLTRLVKVGDMTVSCESAMTKPPKDKAKAQEAFDVCGTLKKK